MKFTLCFLGCLVLSCISAWIFGTGLKDTYPEGIYVFAPQAGEEEVASNAFFIGMAIGSFFCGLIYAAMSACALLVTLQDNSALKSFILPLFAAAAVSLGGTALAVHLAG